MASDEQNIVNETAAIRQYQQTNQDRDEEIVQVVHQSDQHGALVAVESTSLLGTSSSRRNFPPGPSPPPPPPLVEDSNYDQHAGAGAELSNPTSEPDPKESTPPVPVSASLIGSNQEQLSRATSTLPSVAEESFGGNAGDHMEPVETSVGHHENNPPQVERSDTATVVANGPEEGLSALSSKRKENAEAQGFAGVPENTTGLIETAHDQHHQYDNADSAQQAPIYSTIRKTQRSHTQHQQQQETYDLIDQQDQCGGELYDGAQEQPIEASQQQSTQQLENNGDLIDYLDDNYQQTGTNDYERYIAGDDSGNQNDSGPRIDEEIGHTLSRQRAGAVEKGSFRNNFRKKLGLSVSTNENDLTAYRQKLLESSIHDHATQAERSSDLVVSSGNDKQHLGSVSSKFKRTHSVSFNVNSSRSNRHSVDIRNLPSYLTHKRTSIVDVARGAMSSLMSSLGSGSGGGSGSGSAISNSQRRESLRDEEPIFEEPIAPTLSLGQRVAMVRNIGAEFGTVGWIGQLPDVDNDWIVGVIFDNMIGDCDGAYNGVRYFYARENYAMFVPLSTLTKTDNYIGRPETGTMLSRMSVSLKPGQLISIQRSSIRLQHCFLNAPHQRVGHDVRAVSNRLHCQCHNCGPCAHLTKQGRINALPHFGAHHLPHKNKNSLAHAAVEMLAHHHHHFHEEEEHEEKDYEFGDNAAHACNFVRYSCCQQSGTMGHEFSRDCEMVRPELLDNLIHAPKAPHRRQSRPRRAARGRRLNPNMHPRPCQIVDKTRPAALEGASNTTTLEANQSTMDKTVMTSTLKSSLFDGFSEQTDEIAPPADGDEGVGEQENDDRSDQSSYLSSRSSGNLSRSGSSPSHDAAPAQEPYNYYQYDTSGFRPTSSVYNTINSQISFLDQQRFVYQRDSAALMQSPKQSNDSDGTSNFSEPTRGPSLGLKRILRCLGCIRQRHSRHRRPRRKLSFRDRVLEYRRRQSTFVPSTLAKPHEDFASHGIMLPHSSSSGGKSGRRHNQSRDGGEINSDYSSCSRSSCSSSRSNSPPNYPDTAACLNMTIPMQTQAEQQLTQRAINESNRHIGTVALEHEQPSSNCQLKSGQQHRELQDFSSSPPYQPQLNYGDFTFGDGYHSHEKHEQSRDSALTDLGFTDTYKSNSSDDTLKHLIDQSVNEQVSLPQPLLANIDDMISPLSSASHQVCEQGDQESPHSGQYEISSLTASVADNGNADEVIGQDNVRRELEDLSIETDECHDQTK